MLKSAQYGMILWTKRNPKTPQYLYSHLFCFIWSILWAGAGLGNSSLGSQFIIYSPGMRPPLVAVTAHHSISLTCMLHLTFLLPFAKIFKEHFLYRCLRATWTTAKTQTTPGWRKLSWTSTWIEKVWQSQKLTTRCVYINSLHGWFFSN